MFDVVSIVAIGSTVAGSTVAGSIVGLSVPVAHVKEEARR